MLEKFLREVVVIIIGKSAEEVANILNKPKHVNEFTIATKLEITINQTRNILYKLSDFGLVSHIRKKDKKKGWYTYFWKTEILRALEFLKGQKVKRIGKMHNQIHNRETQEFYICERCNIEATEENALLQEFTCNECGDIFTRRDNSKLLRELKKNSDRMTSEVEEIEKEIVLEKERLEKIKIRVAKKEAKKVKASRDERAVKRRVLKALEEKKSGKKKKKVVKKKKPVKKKKKVVKKKAVKKKVAKKSTKKSTKKTSKKKKK